MSTFVAITAILFGSFAGIKLHDLCVNNKITMDGIVIICYYLFILFIVYVYVDLRG